MTAATTSAATIPTRKLSDAGVSIWLDDLSRERLRSGSLQALVEEKNVVGVTTNPTIFAAALANGEAYEDQVRQLAAVGADVDQAVLAITTDDVREACDLFAPVHEATGGVDGRVSIEVDPRLAQDAEATAAMAQRLSQTIVRDNALIKIPATEAGLPAITATIAEGISVNVTLIFSLQRYRAVLDAYMLGLERAAKQGKDLSTIHSVASFFVSRVDTEIDARLDEIGTPEARGLKGKAGLANAQLAYRIFQESLDTDRWARLAAAGANPQRPLWASTGVKNPNLPDTLYVEGLVAPHTVNTMPEKTLEATYDHARITGDTITGAYQDSVAVLDQLVKLGVSYQQVVEHLEAQGLAAFEKSWAELLATVSAALDNAR